MNNILYEHQYVFQQGLGTQNTIVYVVDMICDKVCRSELAGGVFLDLSKTFDYWSWCPSF